MAQFVDTSSRPTMNVMISSCIVALALFATALVVTSSPIPSAKAKNKSCNNVNEVSEGLKPFRERFGSDFPFPEPKPKLFPTDGWKDKILDYGNKMFTLYSIVFVISKCLKLAHRLNQQDKSTQTSDEIENENTYNTYSVGHII